MKIAIYPGTFDPVTEGHVDIIRRAAKLFDRLYVAVMVNVDKKTVFSSEERVDLLKRSLSEFDNVEVVSHQGLLAAYAATLGATTIVKGLRNVADFESEAQMALINRKLNPALDTVFLTTDSKYLFLSSTAVRSVGGTGGDIEGFVPEAIRQTVAERLSGKQ